MKKIMAFVLVSFLSASASFAQTGPTNKPNCSEILDKVRAAKAAATQSAPAAPAAPGAPADSSSAK